MWSSGCRRCEGVLGSNEGVGEGGRARLFWGGGGGACGQPSVAVRRHAPARWQQSIGCCRTCAGLQVLQSEAVQQSLKHRLEGERVLIRGQASPHSCCPAAQLLLPLPRAGHAAPPAPSPACVPGAWTAGSLSPLRPQPLAHTSCRAGGAAGCEEQRRRRTAGSLSPQVPAPPHPTHPPGCHAGGAAVCG
jgi:hypothetical protein